MDGVATAVEGVEKADEGAGEAVEEGEWAIVAGRREQEERRETPERAGQIG